MVGEARHNGVMVNNVVVNWARDRRPANICMAS
jgi:hypothetical protein